MLSTHTHTHSSKTHDKKNPCFVHTQQNTLSENSKNSINFSRCQKLLAYVKCVKKKYKSDKIIHKRMGKTALSNERRMRIKQETKKYVSAILYKILR